MNHKERMIAGKTYLASDPQLVAERAEARRLCHLLATEGADPQKAAAIARELLPNCGQGLFVTPPFQCDYGYNIRAGERFYCNFNCVILDGCPVHIGNDVMFGPSVHVYTATHPVDPEQRVSGIEFGKPVIIGDKVWVGGGSIICPGVTIGEGSVIGAGSVVTRDIPARTVAAGNPARVIRPMDPERDRVAED